MTASKSDNGEPFFRDSVGKTFRSRRQQMGLSLTDISRDTKIQRAYLEAIETSDWQRIPHSVHVLGFIRNYARLLGLDSEVAVTKYLLERGPLATLPNSQPPRQRVRTAIVGSRWLIGAVAGVILVGVVGYLLLQLSVLAAPPTLDVTTPLGDQQSTSASITVSGKTTPGANVTINGSSVFVGDDGSFSTTLTLNPGLNTITVQARNRAGKTTKTERNVLVNTP